ncbi:MAG: HIT domain-containing protein [Candidatus Bathyarchaeota archaeon]|nr:HIT domain-containing protein [Candidatus Bathyarchaeota archaeon]
MKYLWAPWRIKYILMKKPNECIFCKIANEKKDKKNHVLLRGKWNYIVLNNYPYNNGHLMVVPFKHVKSLENLTDEELYEHFKIVRKSVRNLKKAFKPRGFNIGINIGKVAGAGVENHIHTHIVPRWSGDTNYMPVIANTKVIPETLNQTYNRLKKFFSYSED